MRNFIVKSENKWGCGDGTVEECGNRTEGMGDDIRNKEKSLDGEVKNREDSIEEPRGLSDAFGGSDKTNF